MAIRKFVGDVEQITLSGPHAYAKGQQVWYVTERAVFKVGADGLEDVRQGNRGFFHSVVSLSIRPYLRLGCRRGAPPPRALGGHGVAASVQRPNRRSKLAVVSASSAATSTPRTEATTAAVATVHAGSLRLPR